MKKSLERSENELGLAKKQLEDREGKQYLIKEIPYRKDSVAKNDRNNVGIVGATNKVATLREAVSAAESKAAAECTEREKQEARVAEARQKIQALVEKHESL